MSPTTADDRRAGPGDRGLARRIREATAEAHQEAEHAPFVQDLLGGRLAVADYARLLAQHHAIYSVLEELVAARTGAELDAFCGPELARLPAIEADLEFLVGPRWAAELPLLESTGRYCARLRAVGPGAGPGLLAHHYVRYLGDLSGGQLISRVLQKVYGFAGDDGTRSYRFPAIGSPKAFKVRYRNLLDALPWDEEAQDRMIEEARLAYRLITDVFFEMESVPTGTPSGSGG